MLSSYRPPNCSELISQFQLKHTPNSNLCQTKNFRGAFNGTPLQSVRHECLTYQRWNRHPCLFGQKQEGARNAVPLHIYSGFIPWTLMLTTDLATSFSFSMGICICSTRTFAVESLAISSIGKWVSSTMLTSLNPAALMAFR